MFLLISGLVRMRVLLNIILVIFLSFSITPLPIMEEYYDYDDTTGLAQLVPEAYGLLKNKSGDNNLMSISLSRNGLANKSMLWPGPVIPVSVEGSYSLEEREMIILAMDTIDYWTCIRFIAYTGQEDYIAIINTPNKGCNSLVGYQGGRQEIQLEAPKCFNKVGDVLHELLHAIGLIDEERRPDRDHYIFIHEDNIKDGEEEHFQIYTQEPVDDYSVPYDYNSVMHSSTFAFSKNGLMTLEPIIIEATIGQRDRMSVRDALKVVNMYQCLYEIDKSQNFSRILPNANETYLPKDMLMALYFKEKMTRN